MAPTIVHLPNGQTLTVSPVFAGLSFKSNDLNVHQSVFPPGWTIIIESEEELEPDSGSDEETSLCGRKKNHVHRYRNPTLHNDNLFISSISNPSNIDFKPATSPTRQIAMMLWATLWWYFHQPVPNPHLTAGMSSSIPEAGRPKGDWRVHIKREGIFKSKLLFPKLERMGLISTEESCVGDNTDSRSGHGWKAMFVSQRTFWQLDARIFLFTLSPTMHSPFPGATPMPSRPGSPNRDASGQVSPNQETPGTEPSHGLWSPLPGPFASSSHLPTFYPPPPPQHIMTHGVRHPVRPKPPAQGEVFYTRYIPSTGQFLRFRTASLSQKAPTHRGPVSTATPPNFLPPNSGVSSSTVPSFGNLTLQPSDTELLHEWMNNPRVNASWDAAGPVETQETFLRRALNSKHSFPVMGCWDGKPFGYFEIYWVKEDQLGKYITGRDATDWDRGFHALVGEEEFRGPHRVKIWMSALVHYCWLADQRTENVLVEPRVDNEKFISYLLQVGFHQEREIAFPFKQAALMQICRDAWDAPALFTILPRLRELISSTVRYTKPYNIPGVFVDEFLFAPQEPRPLDADKKKTDVESSLASIYHQFPGNVDTYTRALTIKLLTSLALNNPASSTPSTTLLDIIGRNDYTQPDNFDFNRMQLDNSSSADSLHSSVESTDLGSDETTATDIELDSDGRSEKGEDNSQEEDSTDIELDSDSDSDSGESGSRGDANEQESIDEEDYMIINGASEIHEMPSQQGNLSTFHSGNMLLRKGKTVELRNGDFLRIRLIVQAETTEVHLQGLRFQRSHKLDGIVTKHANEVIWVEEIFMDGSAEEEQIPLGEVLRIRKLRMTNKCYESLNLKHTMKWPPTTILYKDEGILFCRMKYEVVYRDQAQKAKDNSFSFVEKCVRSLASEETDGESWEDPADLRANHRGDESPTLRRLRRSVSSMTLLGDPQSNSDDDDVQEVPNPGVRQKPYTFGDVFCGGGGMSCGAQLAGLMVRWGLDFNIDAMRTYQLNFKDATGECTSVEHFLNASIYPPAQYHVDVLHMSPPCQSFSPAQTVKPEDFEDKQVVILAVNNLVKMIKPRIITMEETFGLLHEVNRNFFKCVVNSLTEQGYSVRWKVMNFIEYGVPQARRRVVLIAAGPGETLPAFPAPTHINNPQTIASTISNIPPNASNHRPKNLPYPKRPYDPNSQLRSLIATAGGDDNYHPSGHRGFTEREFASLQTFPRDFVFVGTRTAVVRQIGNAVPPLPGKTIYEEVIRTLRKTDEADRM